MVETIVLEKPAKQDDTILLYDTVREMARVVGKEKAFVAEFGTRHEFLSKCKIKEA